MNDPQGYFAGISVLLDRTKVTDRAGNAMGLGPGAEAVVARLGRVRELGGKALLVGNGGSASIAGHMEMDLCNRVGMRALVFNDPPVLTALANDHGYEGAFERLVGLWADDGDVLIAISSSGSSANIVRAAEAALGRGAEVVTLSGFDSANPLRGLGAYNFWVDSGEYGEVEVAHHAIGHYLTDAAAAARERS